MCASDCADRAGVCVRVRGPREPQTGHPKTHSRTHNNTAINELGTKHKFAAGEQTNERINGLRRCEQTKIESRDP